MARIVCLRLLERRARSRVELEQALRKRAVPDDAAVRVLDRFAAVGLIDDAALAQQLTESAQRQRGLARRAIGVTLRRRGLDDEAVVQALADVDSGDERARAESLVRRRQRSLRGLPAEVQTRRLVGLLARKGYPAGITFEVVRGVLAEVGAADLDAGDLDAGDLDAGDLDAGELDADPDVDRDPDAVAGLGTATGGDRA